MVGTATFAALNDWYTSSSDCFCRSVSPVSARTASSTDRTSLSSRLRIPARMYSVSAEIRSPFASCLEHLGRGPTQSTLDLAQVRVRDTGLLSELAQRQLGCHALLAEVLAEVAHGGPDSELGHDSILLTPASRVKPEQT